MFFSLLCSRALSAETHDPIMWVFDKNGLKIKEMYPAESEQGQKVMQLYNIIKSLVPIDTKIDDIINALPKFNPDVTADEIRGKLKVAYLNQYKAVVEDTVPVKYLFGEMNENIPPAYLKVLRPHVEHFIDFLGMKSKNFKAILDDIEQKKLEFTMRDLIKASELPANYIYYSLSLLKYLMTDDKLRYKDIPLFLFSNDNLLNFMKNYEIYLKDDIVMFDEVTGSIADSLKTFVPFVRMLQGFVNRTTILALEPFRKFLPTTKLEVKNKLIEFKDLLTKLDEDEAAKQILGIKNEAKEYADKVDEFLKQEQIVIVNPNNETKEIIQLISKITDNKLPLLQIFFNSTDFRNIKYFLKAINDGKSDLIDDAVKSIITKDDEYNAQLEKFKKMIKKIKADALIRKVDEKNVRHFSYIMSMSYNEMRNAERNLFYPYFVPFLYLAKFAKETTLDYKIADIFEAYELEYDPELYQKATQVLIDGVESIKPIETILTVKVIEFLKDLKSRFTKDATIRSLLGSSEIGNIFVALHTCAQNFASGGSFISNFKSFSLWGFKPFPFLQKVIATKDFSVYDVAGVVKDNSTSDTQAYNLASGFIKIIDQIYDKSNSKISVDEVFKYLHQDLKFYQSNIYPEIKAFFYSVPELFKMLTLVDATTFFDAIHEIAIEADDNSYIKFDTVALAGNNLKTTVYPQLEKGWDGDTQSGADPFNTTTNDKKKHVGLIVGISIAAVALVVIIIAGVWFFVIKRKDSQTASATMGTPIL